MPHSTISSADALPRFRQIVDDLRREIAEGALPEHAALPSERTVAELHGVSRMTARRALEAVEAEGLAYSEGRKGRFVSPKRLKYDISNRVSFAADAQAAGTELEIELIDWQSVKADPHLAALLSVPAGEKLHRYTRLFRTQATPPLSRPSTSSQSAFPACSARICSSRPPS